MANSSRASGLTARAVAGASWIFASTTLGRLVAMLGQIGIGWLLKPEDFGAWALALAMSSAVMALRNGGTTQILIQRGHNYAAEARFFLRYSLGFNLLVAVILVGLSFPYLLENNAVGLALLGIAISVPLATPAMLSRANLTIEGRFGALALINLGATTLWQVSVLVLAYLGFGAASFACAPVLQALFETVTGRLTAGRLPRESRARAYSDYRALLRQSGWIMLSAAVLSLATTGDYFAVGMLTDLRTVGIYYFAFQTVVALSMPIYSGIESVMPSLLVQLNDDTARQMAAFTRAVQAIVIAALPLAIGFGLAAPLVIHLLWHGKWDIAAHATQILAACVPAWLVIHATRALLEARGFWRLRFALLAVNGAGGISAAAVGTLFNSVESIAAAVAVFYVSFSLSLLLVLSRLGLSLRDVTAIAIKPLAVNFTALLCSAGLTRWMFADHDAATLAALQPAAFLLSTVVGNLALFRDEWTALLKGFTARRRIPGQSPAP